MSFDNGMDMPSGASVTSPALESAELRLKQTVRSYSRTQHELSTLMSVRSQTPMSQAESINKDREIGELQVRLQAQDREVRELKEMVEKQRMTILQQSKAIQQPKQPYATPGPGAGQGQGPGPHQPASFHGPKPPYPQAPAPLLGPRSGPAQQQPNPTPPMGLAYQPPTGPRGASQLGQGQPQWNKSGYQPNQMLPPPPQPQFGQHATVNPFGSPEPRPQSIRSGFPSASKHSSHSSRSNPSTDPRRSMAMQGNHFSPSPQHTQQHQARPQPSYQPYPQSSPLAGPAPPGGGRDLQLFKTSFENVVNMAQKYAFAHVNHPSTTKDQQMPQEVKDRLLSAATTTTAFQFMSSPYTRYFLVTKIIIQWLLKNVFTHDCFRGVDAVIDKNIAEMKKSIYQTTPAQVKFSILNSIGLEVIKIRHRPDFLQQCQNLAHQRGNEIWAILKPMMHQKTSRDWEDLLQLMVEAHKAAAYMFSGAEEYRFDLPLCGALFAPGRMVARDVFPNVKSEQALVAERAQVRLAITPHVTVRSSTPEGHVDTATVVPASVLLKVGN